MSQLGGLKPTGREIKEPTGTLIELTDGDRKYTAIQFDEAYRGHSALTVGVDLIRSFLEYPMVTGLAEMSASNTKTGTYTFKTGAIWTLAEVLRTYRDIGQKCGVRPAIELLYLGAHILEEAGDTGPSEGCYSHGNLTPWRIALRADGSVQIFGYGLPPVDWLRHRNEEGFVVDAESVRNAPPERLEQDIEDPAADTYSLVVIAWEMITGQPLLPGHDVAALKKEISTAQPQQRVFKAKVPGVTKAVLDVLARALTYDPDARLTGGELRDELGVLLQKKLPGPSLADLMERIRGKDRKTPRGRKIATVEGTGVFTPEMLAEAAAATDDEDEDEVAAEEKRWAKSKRAPKDDAPAAAESEAAAPAAEKPRRRRRRASEEAPAEPQEQEAPRRQRRRATPAVEEAAEQPVEEAPPEAPRRRRRTAEPEVAEAPAEAPRRRRRRAEEPSAEPAPVDTKADSPKRRRRRTAPEAVPAADAMAPAEEPRRRRRRTQPSAEADIGGPAAEAAAPEAEASIEAKPRRARRRAEPAEPADPTEGAATPEPAAAEEAAPRRRRRRSAPTDQKSPSDEPDPAEDKPRRRRRRTE